MPWIPVTSSAATWSADSATDVGRQFQTIGSIASHGDYVNFVLTVDESHPIYLSEAALPYTLVQEVMVTP
jgi:hypothetical protein